MCRYNKIGSYSTEIPYTCADHHHLHLIYFHSLLPPSLDQFLCSFFPSSLIFFTFSPYLFSSLTPFSLPPSIHCIASSMVNCSAHLSGTKHMYLNSANCKFDHLPAHSLLLHKAVWWLKQITITLHHKFNFKLASKLCKQWSHKFISHMGLIWTLLNCDTLNSYSSFTSTKHEFIS